MWAGVALVRRLSPNLMFSCEIGDKCYHWCPETLVLGGFLGREELKNCCVIHRGIKTLTSLRSRGINPKLHNGYALNTETDEGSKKYWGINIRLFPSKVCPQVRLTTNK